MKNKIFLYVLFLTFSNAIYAQQECQYKIYYPAVVNVQRHLNLGLNDLINHRKQVVHINLLTCEGASEVKMYQNDTLILRGNLINGLRLLAGQLLIIDPETYDEHIGVVEYYEPLPEGLWQYWDTKGKKIKEEVYNKGVLISSSDK
jgi:antitoxin component YwqK of YwqJK toxin-antitoxin module